MLTSRHHVSKMKRSIKDRVVLTTVGRPLRKIETIVRRRHNRHLHMITSCETIVTMCKFCLRRRHDPSKKQDIVKSSCGPYDERLADTKGHIRLRRRRDPSKKQQITMGSLRWLAHNRETIRKKDKKNSVLMGLCVS